MSGAEGKQGMEQPGGDPKLEAVFLALRERRDGHEVSATCPDCGKVLWIFDYTNVGTLMVNCPGGCINFRLRFERPKP